MVNYYDIIADKRNRNSIKGWIQNRIHGISDVRIDVDDDMWIEIGLVSVANRNMWICYLKPETPFIINYHDKYSFVDMDADFKDFLYTLTRQGKIDSLKEL
jgi:hypothetical protein